MKVSDFRTMLFTIPWHPIYTVCQGILIGISLHANYTKSIALSIVCAFLHLLFTQINHEKAIIYFLIGLFLGSFQTYRIEHAFFQAALCTNKTKISLYGTVTDINEKDEHYNELTLKITEAEDTKKPLPLLCNWNIRIICPKNNLLVGDLVALKNIYLATWTANSGYLTYLLNRSQLGIIRTKQIPENIYRPRYSIRRTIASLKKKIIQNIEYYTEPETALLIKTIFLGKKQQNSPRFNHYKKRFQVWGISHYLARSGLHLSLIALLINLLALLTIPWFFVRIWLVIATSLIYALTSWNSISFTRALSFLLLLSLGSLRTRPAHSLVVFCWIVIVTLLLHPYQLFALDFQLSFLLSGILIWRNQINSLQSIA